MKSARLKMLICVGIFFLLVFGWYGIKKVMIYRYMSHYTQPPATISATEVKEKNWPHYVNAVGTLTAINGVDLTTPTPGLITEIHFTSSQNVKKNEVLLQLDAKKEIAELRSQLAKLQLATINYDREKSLFDKKASSKAMLDARHAEHLEAKASVEATKAKIDEKSIKAPFDGQLGIRLINLGQYISPGTPIVTLQMLDPLYVYFNLPEKYVSQLHLKQAVELSFDAPQSNAMIGEITAINAKVDPITRNILVQATIPNKNKTLYPGMFANVKVLLSSSFSSLVVPETAISYSLSGNYIFVVKKDNEKFTKAIRQFVKVGERRNGEVTIIEGLNPKEMVVTSGQLKLQNETQVIIDNNVEL